MKWYVSALVASVLFPSALMAKGLDKLQPQTEQPDAKDGAGKKTIHKKDGAGSDDKGDKDDKDDNAKDGDKDKEEGEEGNGEKPKPKEPEVPVPPGFQNFYLGAGFGLVSVKGSTGTWDGHTAEDLEAGYHLAKLADKLDLWGTGRYRPIDVVVSKDDRQYRGVVESYLIGGKAQFEINSKLFAVGSAELGLSRPHLRSIDSIPGVDGALEKSGVDLDIGGGVSYLVLDKIALGAQLHLGVGTYKTTQFGVDLRFLL